MSASDPMELIYSLIGYPDETEWIEFKSNNNDADRIGKDISALANSAAYHGKDFAYKIWGVEDKTHALIGSSFSYLNARAEGNQYLSIWLATMMSSNASYEFIPVENNGLHFVVLKISAAAEQPVYFKNIAYIREGSSTTHLKPGSKEAELWRRLQRHGFETQAALEDLASADVFELLNTDVYFSLLGLKRPTDSEATFRPLIEQDILKRLDNGRLAITNLGALLLARKVSAFPGLRKRALRIVKFEGKANLSILDDRFFDEGYATALQKAEDYIMTSIPAKELTDGAFRKIQHAYPQAAIRELLVNTVIHQDMTVTTSGPFVSLYDNRIEFNNPGASLIPPNRVLNAQPKTRNDRLVKALRQMDLCEEGGTGWDRAVAACEEIHMLAPRIESSEDTGTKVTLFKGGAYRKMTKNERINALYWHCCLMYAQGESMSNQSLRERFGLEAERKNTLAMSRLLRECCENELIKEEDEDAGAKFKRYIPFWA